MAIRDVREYYGKVIQQKLELKEDLKDFEEALKDGYVTEDRLEEIRDEYARMEENVSRLAYILYLIELPKRDEKKERYKKSTADVEAGFDKLNASEKAILDENTSVLKYIREELENIKKTGK